MKLTKPLIFISGFVAGVVYCLYRDVLSKPVEPIDPDDEDTWNSCPPDERGNTSRRYYANGRPKAINWRVAMGMPPKPVVDETVNKILDRMDEDIATLYKITDRLSKALQTPREDDDLYDGLCLENVTRAINNLPERRKPIYTYTDPADKTQPVYVGEPEEVGAWELEQWAKESE